jgi:glutamate synthase (NADPH/NADH) small chain
MGDPKGFLKVSRVEEDEREIGERVRDWHELVVPASGEQVRAQASRCMDCGIPFCHQGCPLGNLIGGGWMRRCGAFWRPTTFPK